MAKAKVRKAVKVDYPARCAELEAAIRAALGNKLLGLPHWVPLLEAVLAKGE